VTQVMKCELDEVGDHLALQLFLARVRGGHARSIGTWLFPSGFVSWSLSRGRGMRSSPRCLR
jgi:hypothetical protein